MPFSRAIGFKKFFFLLLLFTLLSPVSFPWAATTTTVNYTYDKNYQILNATYDGGVRIDYVYDDSGNRLVLNSQPSGGPANNPPNTPSSPLPADNSTVSQNTSLSWQGGDPDSGDVVAYRVYLGTTNNPPLVWNGTQTSFSPGNLNPSSIYYWRVVSTDSHNATSQGPLWKFTTATDATSIITAPSNGITLTGTTYTISGTATPNTCGVSKVEVGITPQGGQTTWYLATGTTSWTYTWNLPIGGIYTLQSRATDNTSHIETPGAGITVTVTTSAITAPSNSATLTGTSYFIKGTATFKTCGLSKIEVSTDNGTTWRPATATSSDEWMTDYNNNRTLINSRWRTWAYNWTLPADGTNTLKSRATDSSGNIETTGANASVVVNNNSMSKTVYAWGYNAYGQLGDGTTTKRLIPVPVGGVNGLSGVVAIADGYYHTAALKSDGSVWTWGYNNYGQLGNNSTAKSTVPVQVTGGQSGTTYLTNVIAIAGGYYHTVALKSDGSVWTWGYNKYGQLGIGNTTDQHSPVQVMGPGSGVVSVATGAYHTVALKSDGSVWTWGYNNYGQLGNSSTVNSTIPVRVDYLWNYAGKIVATAAGGYHTVALASDGTVWTWGYNNYGQLGDGTTTKSVYPIKARMPSGTTAIAAGYYHTVALTSNGNVWAWGYNAYGQIGDNSTTKSIVPNPVVTSSSGVLLGGVVAITGGYYHTVALKYDGSIWTWGRNNYGQLGNNTITQSKIAIPVKGTDGTGNFTNAVAIAGGGYHTAALQYLNTAVHSSGITPPSSTITAPTTDTTLTNCTSYTISGTATVGTGGSNLQFVEVSTDGGSTWDLATGTTSWSYTWNIPAAGQYAVMSRTTDNAFNQEIPGTGKNVTVKSALSGSRSSINLNYNLARPAPITKVSVSSSPLSVNGNASATKSWLQVTSSSGNAPLDVLISINPAGLVARNYTSTVTFSSPYATNSPLAIPVSLTVVPASASAPEHQHYSWDASLTGGNCGVCHLAQGTFLPLNYNIQNSKEFCRSCHNSASVAHDKGDNSKVHSIFVSATTGGGKWPSYGNITAAERNNEPFSRMKDSKLVVCGTCHNSMGKYEDYSRVWEMTSTTDQYTYYLSYGGWANYGYMVPVVYRTTSLMSAPTYSKSRKTYIIDPSEYTYDEITGSVTFSNQQSTGAYIYVTLSFPYLRASSEQNRLCSDCHKQATHEGANCLVCHQAHNTKNIVDVKETIRTPDQQMLPVTFLAYSGAYSFANYDAAYTGICEVCHTQTLYYKRDGTGISNHLDGNNYDGKNCIVCHQHDKGFTTYTAMSGGSQPIQSGNDGTMPDTGSINSDAPAPLDTYSIQ